MLYYLKIYLVQFGLFISSRSFSLRKIYKCQYTFSQNNINVLDIIYILHLGKLNPLK